MKILTAVMLMAVLLGAVFTVQGFAASSRMTLQTDKYTYSIGETVKISGKVDYMNDVPVAIHLTDPSGKIHSASIVPEVNDGLAFYEYEFALNGASVGLWSVTAKYASEYMLYGSEKTSFRVKDSLDILTSPLLHVRVNGAIDGSAGEWAHKYDSKHWKPFVRNPSEVEGTIAFNAYYSNGVLYAIFDIPDKKFDAKDFVEIGIDPSSIGEDFKAGDGVYIFRVFRDGTSKAFKLGSENANSGYRFAARADEGGDIRVQVFDADGKIVKVLDSLRDKTSTSYKGILGIAGLEVDADENIYVLDSDSGMIGKFGSDGRLLGSFGSLGTDIKEFIDPTGIALDASGNIYVADTGNARVQKFDQYGKFAGSFGSMGTLSIGSLSPKEEEKRFDFFESPEAIAVGKSGAYVVDRRNGSVNVFDNNGNTIGSFGSMQSPRGIAIDSKENIYVVEQGNNRVIKFDSTGNVIKSWGAFGTEDGMFKAPYGIAIDAYDNVYVSDSINNRVQKFDSNGNFVAKWGARGNEAGQMVGPHGVAAYSNDIYVADTGNHRVQKFDNSGNLLAEFREVKTGKFIPEYISVYAGTVYVTDPYNNMIHVITDTIREWQSEGTGDGQFRGPFGIAVDNSGNIYVADAFNKRVQKFDPDRKFLLKWGSIVKEEISVKDIPAGERYIAFDSNSHKAIGVLDSRLVEQLGTGSYILESGQVWKILYMYRDTVYVKQVGGYAKEITRSWTPDGIVVDTYGNVYIVDRENEMAKKFSSNGELISKWGSSGSNDGEFAKPTAMDLDSANNVYIVDTGNNRIQKFDSEGNFITKWGGFGYDPGQFNNPRGIAIDDDDNVYVLDNGNSRVQKFDNNGKFMMEWGSQGSSAGQFDNLSTEGIAVDSYGRVYVADLPGASKTTHWVAEVAIPINLNEKFGIFLAEGTYNDSIPLDAENPESVRIIDVYRNSWPSGAYSVLPSTWAEARLMDVSKVSVHSMISIDSVRACTNEVCSDLDGQVLAGSDVIVSASISAEDAPDRFEYDRVKVTLQHSIDGKEWLDSDSKFVLVSRGTPAAVNLKYTPDEDAYLRVKSSGLLTGESVYEMVKVRSESLPLRLDLKWSEKVMQDEQAAFDLSFTSDRLLDVKYGLQVMKDDRVIADLPLMDAEGGKAVYKYTFKDSGKHLLKVSTVGVGSSDFKPLKKTFTYTIDVLPSDSPVKVNTIQKGEAMKIMIKSSEQVNTIEFSFENVETIDYKLPQEWSSSVNMEQKVIRFSSEVYASDYVEIVVRSKAFVTSLYSVCWDLNQSTLVVNVCK